MTQVEIYSLLSHHKPVTEVGSNLSTSTPNISLGEVDRFLDLNRDILPSVDGRLPSLESNSRNSGILDNLSCSVGNGAHPLCCHIPSWRPNPVSPY